MRLWWSLLRVSAAEEFHVARVKVAIKGRNIDKVSNILVSRTLAQSWAFVGAHSSHKREEWGHGFSEPHQQR